MSDILKPCPFCGSPAELRGGYWKEYNYDIYCPECGVILISYSDDPNDLTTQWNTRPIEDALNARIATKTKEI